MAKDVVFEEGNQLYVPVVSGVLSGYPVMLGTLPGVALTDRDTAGNATVKFNGAIEYSVTAAAPAAAGADVNWIAGTPPTLSTAAGSKFGYLLHALATTGVAKVKIGK